MDERWEPISEYPGYYVSDWGYIYSDRTEQQLSMSQTLSGIVKVNLMRDGHIHTRSVKVLVAYAFVPLTRFQGFTPINIDGNQTNNHYLNLAWRPRWFAWKYTRQFNEETPNEYNVRVINILTGDTYDSIMEAGVADGVLWEYVYRSTLTGRPVFPTGGIYELI